MAVAEAAYAENPAQATGRFCLSSDQSREWSRDDLILRPVPIVPAVQPLRSVQTVLRNKPGIATFGGKPVVSELPNSTNLIMRSGAGAVHEIRGLESWRCQKFAHCRIVHDEMNGRFFLTGTIYLPTLQCVDL